MTYVFLAVFWAGAALSAAGNRPGLRERYRLYAGRAKELPLIGGAWRAAARYRAARRGEKARMEITEALSYIKNTVKLGRGRTMSAELLMEELAGLCDILKPAFQDMAHYLHLADKHRARGVLAGYLGEGYAEDLGRFLAGWEDIPPSDLLQSVEIYRNSLREETRTRRMARDELMSDLIYFPVVLNTMLVLLNFVYVAFFIPQREALSALF